MGKLLSERKALLIETTEDTTQPDSARRAGSIELSVIRINTRKAMPPRSHVACRIRKEARGSGRSSESFPDSHKLGGRVSWRLRQRYLIDPA